MDAWSSTFYVDMFNLIKDYYKWILIIIFKLRIAQDITVATRKIKSVMETETSVRVYGTIGTLQEFNIHQDDWVIYKEKLDQYFLANLISDDRRVSVLLTLIGTDAYKVLRDLCDPDLPHSKSYDALCKLLEEQFSIKVSVFRKRIQFYNERQSQTESIRAWYVRMKTLLLQVW